jgi:hypothetical protein
MLHYKPIIWPAVALANILDIIRIDQPDLERVAPLDSATQIKIADMLGVERDLCTVCRIMLVYVPAGKKLWIHSDKPRETSDPGKLGQAVFLPLTDCVRLHWSWYECTDPEKIFYHGEAGKWQTVPMIPDSAAREIETTPASQAMITDIGTWHSLRNLSDTAEIALSFRLMPWSWQDFSQDTALPPIRNIFL